MFGIAFTRTLVPGSLLGFSAQAAAGIAPSAA